MDDLGKYSKYLGKVLTVTIDRPLGSRHPKFDFVYEVNYGFIANTTAGDGDEIDAWVLDAEGPITIYTGKCIAIVIRYDDNENKLVFSASNRTSDEIMSKIGFVENYYQTEIIFHLA